MRRLYARVLITLTLATLSVLAGIAPVRVPNTLADEVMVHMISTCSGTTCQYSFLPQTTTVPAGSGITFMNFTSVAHTATSDDGAFDTGTLSAGGYVRIVFSTPGTYKFHCAIHPDMHVTIDITGAGPPAASTSVATPSATSAPALPTTTATAPPTPPSLTLAVRLSPMTIAPGHRIHLTVRTLPLADLLIGMRHAGMRPAARHVRARQDGSYAATIAIGRRARPGTLKVRVTALLGGQMAQAVATAIIG